MLFQGDTPEGSDTFQWPVIERDRVGGLRLMIWDKVKVPLCHYSDALEESNLWTAWQLLFYSFVKAKKFYVNSNKKYVNEQNNKILYKN